VSDEFTPRRDQAYNQWLRHLRSDFSEAVEPGPVLPADVGQLLSRPTAKREVLDHYEQRLLWLAALAAGEILANIVARARKAETDDPLPDWRK